MSLLLKTSVFLLLATVVGCKSTVEKNANNDSLPLRTDRTNELDPNWIGESSAMVQVPLPQKPSKGAMKPENSIVGHCEMMVVGESKPKPCNDIRLIVRSSRENEVRTAVIDGYNFKINDLNKTNYGLEATSPNYDITTDTKELSPGQDVKIRVNAKPRP
jgi:hypothetical protein